ncbi:MAG: epoxyqueuosine reductase [Treponema sp.]|nr:epoxyqueuosine reductase [Treponema sp.]
MEKNVFEKALSEFVLNDSGNYVAEDIAMRPELAGMQMFDEPIFGYAAADDPMFAQFREPGIIGDHFVLPGEWLDGAQTVISFFLPFTQTVKKANGADMSWPADEWMHARIEGGNEFQKKICRHAVELLEGAGFAAVAPAFDPRFLARNPDVSDKNRQEFFNSNWSERHIAHACGLGTFGLSRGLLTAKGTAGRFSSVVTAAVFAPSERRYTKLDEYCTCCGACARNCPAGAISVEKGKSHPVCSAFLDRVLDKHRPYYGCGKCQVQVPCENGLPFIPV